MQISELIEYNYNFKIAYYDLHIFFYAFVAILIFFKSERILIISVVNKIFW